MIEDLTPESIASDICMRRSTHSGAFLLVESDVDSRFLRPLVDVGACELVPAFGRPNALRVSEILEERAVAGWVVVLDADFDRIAGQSDHGPNVVLTDAHDLECMAFKSPALEKVLETFSSPSRLERFGRENSADVRHAVLQTALPVGWFLFLSQERTWQLDFKDLRYKRFIDASPLACRVEALVDFVCGREQGCEVDRAEAAGEITKLLEEDVDLYQVCRGDDLVGILAIALAGPLRSRGEGDHEAPMRSPRVAKVLRLAYDSKWFRESGLYASIQEWEARNAGFHVLSAVQE